MRLSTNTTHCHGSSLPSMEAKLPTAWTSHGRPPTGHLPTGPKERPPPVIVAKLNHRRAAPTSSREPMPRIEAAAIIQMRRLQEGSDADGATVARPKWTGFSPLDDMPEGKHDAPNREAAPNGVAVAKAFAQEPSSTNAGSRSRTPCQDGLAIAWSCCEYLLSVKAYTVFATHMERLSELATMYPNVKILHFEVDLRNDRLDFKFRLKDGVRRVPHYGLLLARVAGIPTSVIDTSTSITSQITEQEMTRMDANCKEYRSLQMMYQVVQRLICLKYSNQGYDYIREALQNLKESYAAGRLT
ncbi:DNA mismatch repair protein MSH4-like isoform X1 [Miscanthus floridulus]|uniref:DNA mismatch repair protein MSH4-like isoform X1 n=1 Tax=Miscanthus floridulus TaxID=154761 RepID=UPI003457C556